MAIADRIALQASNQRDPTPYSSLVAIPTYSGKWRACMAAEHLTFELPNGLVEALGPSEKLAARARFLLIMDLLRRSEISEGRAAELLGVSRVEMMELAVEHKIPSGPETLEELIADVKTAERASHIRS